jgi:hypothetical protein
MQTLAYFLCSFIKKKLIIQTKKHHEKEFSYYRPFNCKHYFYAT